MKKFILYSIMVTVVVGGIIVTVLMMQPESIQETTNTANMNTVVQNVNTVTNTNTNTDTVGTTFATPKKSAHYETNTPAHGSVLAVPPINVVIDFNFDLSKVSTISIMKDGVEYGTGSTSVDSNKLTLRRSMKSDASDGTYTVSYNACWPDGSCHDGHFQFAIDRTKASSFMDGRGQAMVTVQLKDLAFSPMDIRINPGTAVTWVNNDTVEHYINTDSHPAHTYFPTQNSRALAFGDRFTQIFTDPGAYPYHCSAHAGVMTGNVVVE